MHTRVRATQAVPLECPRHKTYRAVLEHTNCSAPAGGRVQAKLPNSLAGIRPHCSGPQRRLRVNTTRVLSKLPEPRPHSEQLGSVSGTETRAHLLKLPGIPVCESLGRQVGNPKLYRNTVHKYSYLSLYHSISMNNSCL